MQRTGEIEHTCPNGTRTNYSPRTLLRNWRHCAEAEAAIRLADNGQTAHWTTPMGQNTVRPVERHDPIIPHRWASLLARAQDTRSLWGVGVESEDEDAAAAMVERGWLCEVAVPSYIDAPPCGVVTISETGRAVLAAYEAVEDAING